LEDFCGFIYIQLSAYSSITKDLVTASKTGYKKKDNLKTWNKKNDDCFLTLYPQITHQITSHHSVQK